MQDIVAEQKATAGPHSGNRHTATAADGQATPTHINQPNRQPNMPPCPTPNSLPDRLPGSPAPHQPATPTIKNTTS